MPLALKLQFQALGMEHCANGREHGKMFARPIDQQAYTDGYNLQYQIEQQFAGVEHAG